MKTLFKVSILILCLLAVGIAYYSISVSSYQTEEELYGFPIPKHAQLERKTENVRGFDWDKASFENGIPISYKLVIKQNGWKEVDREGGITTYTKGNYKVSLLSDSDYIEIVKET